jgi:hypothetical protein
VFISTKIVRGRAFGVALSQQLACYCTLAPSKQHNEHIKVIHACVHQAVYTDLKLLVVAQNYKTVMALLTDSTLDVWIVKMLWNTIWHLGMHEVRAVIGTSPG